MRHPKIGRTAAILTILTVLGIGAYAYAGPGWGKRGQWGGNGMGDQAAAPANLDDETLTRLKAERTAFFDETADLRRRIAEKDLGLRAELAKSAPDREVALSIQKDISALRAQLDEKRLGHRARMREIAPSAGFGKGYGHGRGMGYGHGRGHGKGWGGHGGGNCRRY